VVVERPLRNHLRAGHERVGQRPRCSAR
jgi:hypothetical protein